MSAAVRDAQRSRVYSAERMLHTILDNSARSGATVQVGGATLTAPPEAKFASIESVQRYVNQVLAIPAVIERCGPVPPVVVRARKGDRCAHYETRTATIAIPDRGEGLPYLREAVVLHETCHHLTTTGAAHGPQFAETLIWLFGVVIGPEAEFMLRVLFAESGVATR